MGSSSRFLFLTPSPLVLLQQNQNKNRLSLHRLSQSLRYFSSRRLQSQNPNTTPTPTPPPPPTPPESLSYLNHQTPKYDPYPQNKNNNNNNIHMKRGDWICSRCTFMNFARNMNCLECDEERPKKHLTTGEWECPQCDFYNYGKNMTCLRCDCKRPGEVATSTSSRPDVDIDCKLAANEEKAQRWFTKVSQLDSNSDITTIPDEDFPEIMPLRKGVNRFVVSTRKTPLERRLANAQYQRNLPNANRNDLQGTGTGKPLDSRLDHILGPQSINYRSISDGPSTHSLSNAASLQSGYTKGSNSDSVPFVPFPTDMFANKPENSKMEDCETALSDVGTAFSANTNAVSDGKVYTNPEKISSQNGGDPKELEQAKKSDRWFKRVAELHNVTDLASAIPDEEFPEIMPMRKGENRFVVNKKKDRNLTSPMYKRRVAMERTANNNYVPFVPFPPGYFANKESQQAEKADPGASIKSPNWTSPENMVANQQSNSGSGYTKASGENPNDTRTAVVNAATTGEPAAHNSFNSRESSQGSSKNGYSATGNISKQNYLTGNSPRQFENQNIRGTWSGKSLEGSAVKEPDPLDMSEEAKAERWFRRAAQIKDINELSQIPDEDFPSIIPMRKGVNRFVVSKRKTPLERRLTSQQYRRNLPVVSSDPLKKENEGN